MKIEIVSNNQYLDIFGSYKKDWTLFAYISSLALTILMTYLGYKYMSWRWSVPVDQTDPINIVEKNLITELFKRLPKELKNSAQKKYNEGGVSQEELSILQKDPITWKDRKYVREISIQACLEEKINKEFLSFIMLHWMIAEARLKLPSYNILFQSSCDCSRDQVKGLLSPFCKKNQIDLHEFESVLGEFSSKEDAFFVVDMDKTYQDKPFHYTAALSREVYPFSIELDSGKRKRLFIFQPHIFEKVLKKLYPKYFEKPLMVLGTKKIEKLSDDTQRVLSLTGGTTIPTPNIEANEANRSSFSKEGPKYVFKPHSDLLERTGS